jgi:S1-C subfamily serine protease
MTDLPRFEMTWRNSILGIDGESLTAQLAEFFGVKEGVLVRSVVKNSAAEKAGIKAGDVIVKVDDATVTSAREISSVLRSLRSSKKTFPVMVVRNKKEMTLSVTIEDRSSGGAERARAAIERARQRLLAKRLVRC